MSEKFNPIGFISRIGALRKADDRKGMAELRRAKSESQQYDALHYVMPYIPDNSCTDLVAIRIMCVIGSHAVTAKRLAIMDQKGKHHQNFGDVLRQLSIKHNGSDTISERYIKRLMSCDRASLVEQINHMLSLVNSHDILIDYIRLLTDMLYWNEKTALQWARSYYRHDNTSTEGK